MPFVRERPTEEVIHKLGLSELLIQRAYGNPAALSVAYDIAQRIALIAQPTDYSTYPDRHFTLCIAGRCLNVWEGADPPLTITSIVVHVSEATQDLDDDFLRAVTRQAFAAFYNVSEFSNKISISGRKASSKFPRPPHKVIAGINIAAETMSREILEFALPFFVPVLVRPEELDPLLAYGRETSWAELSEKGRTLVELAIQQLPSARSEGSGGS